MSTNDELHTLIAAWLSDITAAAVSVPSTADRKKRSAAEMKDDERDLPSRPPKRRHGHGRDGRDGSDGDHDESNPTTYTEELRGRTLGPLTARTTLSNSSSSPSLRRASSLKMTMQTRTKSPVKAMKDLQDAKPPTRRIHLQPKDLLSLPPAVVVLHQDVESAMFEEVVPALLREDIEQHTSKISLTNPRIFYTSALCRETLARCHESILEVHGASAECDDEDQPEPCICEGVVRPLIQEALKLSQRTAEVAVKNISLTSISPLELLQVSGAIDALPTESKRVDYGLFLKPNESMAERIKSRLQRILDQRRRSINQTSAIYTRSNPLLIPIEVKTKTSSIDPLIQLSIWSSAGMQCLTELGDSLVAEDVLPMPMISIEGSNWYISYMFLCRAKHGDDLERVVAGKYQIGSTESVLGIYQIVSVLRVLFAWMCGPGLQFYETYILP